MSDMSAPQGDATADAPEQAESTVQEAQPTQPSHDDRLNDRLEEMQRAIQQMAEMQQQQYQPDDDEDEYELEPGDDGYDEWAQQKALDDYIEAKLQERLSPLQMEQQVQQRNQAWGQLTDQYPQLQDNDFASQIVEAAAHEAEDIGLDVNSPKFVRLIELHYKAHVADQAAQRETPAGQRPQVQLESQGAAGPQDREEDIQARLIQKLQASSGI